MAQITLDTKKPIGMNFNCQQAKLLLKGLMNLSDSDKNNVIYDRLIHDLNTIITIWERRIKNEKIIQEQKRTIKAVKKRNIRASQRSS